MKIVVKFYSDFYFGGKANMEISDLKIEVELTAKQIDRKIYKAIAPILEEQMKQEIDRKHIQKRKKQIADLLINFSDNLDILVNRIEFDAKKVVENPKDVRDTEIIKGCQKAMEKLLIETKKNSQSLFSEKRISSIQPEEVQIVERTNELIAILKDMDYYMEEIKECQKEMQAKKM